MLISGRRWEQRHSFQLALFVRLLVLLVTLGMVPVCIACGVWLATMWEMFPQIGRLTNLMQLTVDTSYWTKYRSRTKNPDFGDTFAPAIPGLLKGRFPAIPRNDDDLAPDDHIQAIANTAAFHFAFIEQGGTSLYPSLAQRVTNAEVLRILLSIGPTETAHFQTWHDKAGNAKPLTDPTNGLVFPDLNSPPCFTHAPHMEHHLTGIKVSDDELAALNLSRDSFHGEWNYTIKPLGA